MDDVPEAEEEEFDGVMAWQESQSIAESVRKATNVNRSTNSKNVVRSKRPRKRQTAEETVGVKEDDKQNEEQNEEQTCVDGVLDEDMEEDKSHESFGSIVLEKGEALLVPTIPTTPQSPLTATHISFASKRSLERMHLALTCSYSTLAMDIAQRCTWAPMVEATRRRGDAGRMLCLQGCPHGVPSANAAFLLRSEHDGIPNTPLPNARCFGIVGGSANICNATRPRTIVVSTGRGEESFAVTLGQNECLLFQSQRTHEHPPLSFQLFPLDRGNTFHDTISIAVVTFS